MLTEEEVKARRRACTLRHHHKTYQRVLAAVGLVCVRCGFDDPRALAIDHIHSNGAEERRKFGATTTYYNQMLTHLEDYQTLCCNCNRIKQHEHREFRPKL